MDRVAIVTDSSANLPPELIQQWGISVVPALLGSSAEWALASVALLPPFAYLAGGSPVACGLARRCCW